MFLKSRVSVALFAGLMLLAGGAPVQASTAQVFSAGALGANDYFDWGQFTDGVAVSSPQGITSNLARNGTISDGGSFTGLVEGTDWFGNFTIGDNLLFTGDTADVLAAANAFTVDFTTAIAGLGLQIHSNFFGDFTASIEVFDGGTSLGLFSVSGTNNAAEDGSAPFLGVQSSLSDINSAVFTLTSNTGAGFGVNRLITTDIPSAIPEPEIYAMMGIGLALMGLVARRRRGQAVA